MSQARPPLLPSLSGPSHKSSLAWSASTALAAVLVSGLAAWALSVPPSSGESTGEADAPLMLSLAPAPAIEAISEPAPEVSEAVEAPTPVQTEELPDVPELTEAPELPSETPLPQEISAEDVPVVDNEPPPALSEMVIPQKPKPKPEPKPESKPEPPKEPKPEKPVKRTEKPAQPKASDGSASAQTANAAASAGSGSKAAKSYGADVMKKIRKTKKRRAPSKGLAVVQFTVAANGSLASVGLAKSSGSAGLDELALDHIRRSAPFKAPPPGAQTRFSFEFKS